MYGGLAAVLTVETVAALVGAISRLIASNKEEAYKIAYTAPDVKRYIDGVATRHDLLKYVRASAQWIMQQCDKALNEETAPNAR